MGRSLSQIGPAPHLTRSVARWIAMGHRRQAVPGLARRKPGPLVLMLLAVFAPVCALAQPAPAARTRDLPGPGASAPTPGATAPDPAARAAQPLRLTLSDPVLTCRTLSEVLL